VSESFSVGDTESIAQDDAAFALLAGTFPGPGSSTTFDWGLPFYFGRTVYTAIQGSVTSVGTGPYVAF
jgi:microcystin-dependent protein